MKNKILNKIKNKEIKMKPRWEFVAWEEGKKSMVAMGLLLASLMMGMMVYWWEMNKPEEIISMGEVGVAVILRIFPYWIGAGVATGVVVSGLLVRKIGNNYRKSIEKVILLVALGTMAITLAIMATRDWWELELLLKTM